MFRISIHAPREGGDDRAGGGAHHKKISIHAPREGGDAMLPYGQWGQWLFQSTPPARGATQ